MQPGSLVICKSVKNSGNYGISPRDTPVIGALYTISSISEGLYCRIKELDRRLWYPLDWFNPIDNEEPEDL